MKNSYVEQDVKRMHFEENAATRWLCGYALRYMHRQAPRAKTQKKRNRNDGQGNLWHCMTLAPAHYLFRALIHRMLIFNSTV